jgi:cardiolipin synthase
MARLRFGRKARIVVVTFVATTLAVLLVANLALGDKRIDQQVPVLYSVEDAQFRRSMGVILGP